MVSKKSTRTNRKRPVIRLGEINAHGLTEELRDLHELYDPDFDRFPDPRELFLVLKHTERAFATLKAAAPQHIAARTTILRTTLWEYLREQADVGQLRSADDARDVAVYWKDLAPGMCVSSPNGALEKTERLRAEAMRAPDERRSREVARAIVRRQTKEQRAEYARVMAQERRFPVAQRIARALVEQRAGLRLSGPQELDDPVDPSGMAEYWLDELERTIDDRRTPLERSNFCGYLESFMRATLQIKHEPPEALCTTEGARHAVELATQFIQSEHRTP